METLLNGGWIETEIVEEIIFEQLGDNRIAVWSLLLASGYLKVGRQPEGEGTYYLALTNFEVKKMFRKMIQGWFGRKTVRYNDFIKALLADDVDYMNDYMNQIAMQTFSSFDTGKKPSELSEPERFYHGFVLGLMVDLADSYQIKSNRESGLGRYDACRKEGPIEDGRIPYDLRAHQGASYMLESLDKRQRAYVLEFKVHNPKKEKNLDETVKNALLQIEEKDYNAELTGRGFSKEKIIHFGLAFEGKKVLIGRQC